MLTIGTHRVTLGGHPKRILWDQAKDEKLLAERRIGFKFIAELLEQGAYLMIIDHWNRARYPNQQAFVLEIDGYAYYVPYVETPLIVFLKTIFPSRKATRMYLRRQ
ncbi:MAG: toxin [Elusimicrobia bacterium]|nr:toxin [Elusimicrobiota bacterium]